MDVFLIFMLFFSIFLDVEAIDTNCPTLKCSHDAPDIHFPFSVQGLQPQDCTYPGFGLVCRENKTIIQFPSYGDLVVKSISYDMRKLSLLDPKNCVHEVFLNLNLSLTPFQYYYIVKNYTYLNCSAQLSPSFMQVPCLSGSRYHVYVVDESVQAVPASCKPVKTISIPFSYSPYLSDNSFGLGFTWDLTGRKDFRSGRGCSESWIARCFNGEHGKALSIIIFIFMVATLLGVKIHSSKNAWVEKLFGHLEILKHAKYGNYGTDFKGMLPDEICVSMPENFAIDENGSMK